MHVVCVPGMLWSLPMERVLAKGKALGVVMREVQCYESVASIDWSEW